MVSDLSQDAIISVQLNSHNTALIHIKHKGQEYPSHGVHFVSISILQYDPKNDRGDQPQHAESSQDIMIDTQDFPMLTPSKSKFYHKYYQLKCSCILNIHERNKLNVRCT